MYIFFEIEPIDGRSYSRMLDDYEVLEKYNHLENIYVDKFDVFQKYIPIRNCS